MKYLMDRVRGKSGKGGNEFIQEIFGIYHDQYEYYKALAEALEKVIPAYTEEEYLNSLTADEKISYLQERKEYGFYYKRPMKQKDNPNRYTDELAYKWKYAHEFIDERISWRADGKKFDNFKLEFTVLKENPLTIGSKCTGRYGNKGVCAAIVPDDEMPHTEDGLYAEICLNPLGIINRINPAQIWEQYINFAADHVVKEMKKCDDYNDAQDIYFEFLKLVNKEQYDFVELEFIGINRAKQHEFLDDIMENGIYIHEPPFVGNTSMDKLVELFKTHPEWVEEYKCVNMERPIVIGDEYFIRSSLACSALTAGKFLYLKSYSIIGNDKCECGARIETIKIFRFEQPDVQVILTQRSLW